MFQVKLQIGLWFAALVALVAAFVGYPPSKVSHGVKVLWAGLAGWSTASLLAGVFVFALTGAGFDDAFWYHLRSDKSGFSAYDMLRGGGWAAIGTGLCLAALVYCGRRKIRQRLAVAWAFALLGVATAVSPLNYSVVRQLKFGQAGRAVAPDMYKPYGKYGVPEKKRNLVLIYAESFERTYFDESRFPGLVPNLRSLARRAVDFVDIRQVPSQGYTMAGLVASQTGVPFVVPSVRLGNGMSGADQFYPGAVGFGRMLKREGYRLVYLGGADRRFAGKQKFLEQNGYDEVLGLQELAHLKGDDPADGWGLHDDTLFRIAKDKLREFNQAKRPFVLTILTLDTHFPTGRVPPSLRGVAYQDGANPMLNAVHASDILLAQFIREILDQDPRGETVVVLMSDHLAMLNSATALLERGERRNMMMIFDANRPPVVRDSPGTIFDAAPTILGSLGFSAEAGLGRNMIESPRRETEVAALISPEFLDRYNDFFQSLWHFPQLMEKGRFYARDGLLEIGGRNFRVPVLCTVDGNYATRLYFEFDTYKPTASISHVYDEFKPGTHFIFVGDWSAVPAALKKEDNADAAGMVTVWGEKEGRIETRVLSLDQDTELDFRPLLNQIHALSH
jgi:phosphoglycerol transferase